MSIFADEFYNQLKNKFGLAPTSQQDILMQKLSLFINQKEKNSLFLLKGYAGTGKTTVISALVSLLREKKTHIVLLAPTGRAAKVISNISKNVAHTIHRRIYLATRDSAGNIKLKLQKNKLKNAIFIVDEASMIPDYKPGSRDLLSDLMKFVYEFEFNKTIFIGDTAQLPPVGLEVSPALDLKYLKSNFNLNVFTIELTEVIRQAEKSGILKNATLLRSKIKSEDFKLPFFDLDFTSDIKVLPGYELQEELESSYYNQGYEETVLITRSNKRAYLYNMEIRKRILQKEEEIDAGDMLMIVKNNYFWLDEKSKAGFLANGDILEITNVLGVEEKYGFRFADIQARLVDYPEEVEYGFKIVLDTLKVEAASFTREENNRLFQEILNKYSDEPSKVKRMKKLKEDKYFNALQVKYAYGLTCHKTQGGQWTNVFIDFPYVKEDEINLDYLRWLYTAVTRAKENVFLINFPENFY